MKKVCPTGVNLVARIDYLGFRGEVVESVEYKSEEPFLPDLKERLNCGVPLCVTLYRDQNGKTISRNFLAEVDIFPYSAVSFPTAASSSSLTGETVMMGRMAAPVMACRINSAWLML